MHNHHHHVPIRYTGESEEIRRIKNVLRKPLMYLKCVGLVKKDQKEAQITLADLEKFQAEFENGTACYWHFDRHGFHLHVGGNTTLDITMEEEEKCGGRRRRRRLVFTPQHSLTIQTLYTSKKDDSNLLLQLRALYHVFTGRDLVEAVMVI